MTWGRTFRTWFGTPIPISMTNSRGNGQQRNLQTSLYVGFGRGQNDPGRCRGLVALLRWNQRRPPRAQPLGDVVGAQRGGGDTEQASELLAEQLAERPCASACVEPVHDDLG